MERGKMALLKIGNTDISKLVSYKVSYCKLWSSDTGRSMTGENKGTLIGIFPKIEITLGKMTAAEMARFLKLVNVASADVTYYDTERQQNITASFYFGDVTDEILRQRDMSHKQISVSIIANKRRS
jgi:hypothetical protein